MTFCFIPSPKHLGMDLKGPNWVSLKWYWQHCLWSNCTPVDLTRLNKHPNMTFPLIPTFKPSWELGTDKLGHTNRMFSISFHQTVTFGQLDAWRSLYLYDDCSSTWLYIWQPCDTGFIISSFWRRAGMWKDGFTNVGNMVKDWAQRFLF